MYKSNKKLLALATTTSILLATIIIAVFSFFLPVDDFKAYAQQSATNATTKYKYEPFLTLTDSKFQEIPHNDNLNLIEFTLASWFRTTTQNNTEPVILSTKGEWVQMKKE